MYRLFEVGIAFLFYHHKLASWEQSSWAPLPIKELKTVDMVNQRQAALHANRHASNSRPPTTLLLTWPRLFTSSRNGSRPDTCDVWSAVDKYLSSQSVRAACIPRQYTHVQYYSSYPTDRYNSKLSWRLVVACRNNGELQTFVSHEYINVGFAH